MENIFENIALDKEGVCMYVARELTKHLLSRKITNFKVIEGFVWTFDGEDDDYPTSHTWVEFYDGSKLDPSSQQFDRYGGIDMYISGIAYDQDGDFYRKSKTYTPEEYLSLPMEEVYNIKHWKKNPNLPSTNYKLLMASLFGYWIGKK